MAQLELVFPRWLLCCGMKELWIVFFIKSYSFDMNLCQTLALVWYFGLGSFNI